MELGKGNAKFADYHHIKGCHAFKTGFYKGSVFYGLGGNEKEISEDFDLDATAYRPKGYDCSSNGNTLIISSFFILNDYIKIQLSSKLKIFHK